MSLHYRCVYIYIHIQRVCFCFYISKVHTITETHVHLGVNKSWPSSTDNAIMEILLMTVGGSNDTALHMKPLTAAAAKFFASALFKRHDSLNPKL